MWQEFVVGALVACSAAYAVWALMPAAARLRLAQRIRRGSDRRPAMRWLHEAARSAESRAQKRLAGCGNCDAAATTQRDETRR